MAAMLEQQKEKQEAKSGKGKEKKKRCNYNQCATEDHWLGSGL
jgi:hypothetical protein